MADKLAVTLGEVQETLLIPLYGRAVETGKKRPVLRDPKAVEMVASIDYDFARFDGGPSLLGSVLRTAIFDTWVRAFVAEHPTGTVVEIGTGLNTRFERLDNGTIHWVDLDLPDSMELRRRFFADTDRRRTIAASVLDDSWVAAVKESPGPYFFVSEAVLLYLPEPEVRQALTLVAENFSGARVALDTGARWMIDNQDRLDAIKDVAARLAWACDDPREVERWGLGLRLLDSRNFLRLPRELRPQVPARYRFLFPVARLLFPKRSQIYKFNLFEVA